MPNTDSQRDMILRAERELGIGPVKLARRMQTPYHTLKDWKSGRTVMPGVAWCAIDLLLNQKDD